MKHTRNVPCLSLETAMAGACGPSLGLPAGLGGNIGRAWLLGLPLTARSLTGQSHTSPCWIPSPADQGGRNGPRRQQGT